MAAGALAKEAPAGGSLRVKRVCVQRRTLGKRRRERRTGVFLEDAWREKPS